MSSKAMEWAWRQSQVVKGSTHHLLLALCENTNHETGLAFSSIACLMEMTGQDRKTVIANIERILAAEPKLMKDTGAKAGRTRQIPVYQLAPWVKDWSVPEPVGKTGLFDFVEAKRPDIPTEESRFSVEESQKRDTDPSIRPKDGDSPPIPNGMGTPDGELFVDQPLAPPIVPLEEFVLEQWGKLHGEHPGVTAHRMFSPAQVKKIGARAGDAIKGRKKSGLIQTPEEIWRELFEQIRRSAFLTGRAPPGKGRTTPFKLTVDYVLRQDQFFRILDGGYDDGDRHGPGRSYDPGNGRSYGPAEQAGRRALGRLRKSGEPGAGRGNPRSAHG